MNLYILRHGLAAPGLALSPKTDRLRPLTPKGRKRMNKIAAVLKEMGLSWDLILSSPCTRARQTAEIVAEAFGLRRRLEFIKELSVGVPPQVLFQKLQREYLLPEDLLLVGHEPQLSRFISVLLSGKETLCVQLKKGGLCKLSLPSLKGRSHATLEWLLTPRQILGQQE